MSAPSWTKNDPQEGSPTTSRGYGWGDRQHRQRATASTTASGRPPAPPPAPDRQTTSTTAIGSPTASAGDRQPNLAGGAAPVEHEIDVPAEGEGGALVMRSRGTVAAREAAEGLRFANMRNKSLAEVLRFARDGEDNLSHLLAFYAFKVAFFYCITVPVLTVVEYVKWVCVRPHRFLLFCLGYFGGASVVNRFADGVVPDGLDASTWSPAAWAWVAGGAFVLLVATVVTYVKNR